MIKWKLKLKFIEYQLIKIYIKTLRKQNYITNIKITIKK